MKYYDSGILQTDDGAVIISQVHSTGFVCVCVCVCLCVFSYQVRAESRGAWRGAEHSQNVP